VSALCLAALVPARAQNQTSIVGLGRKRRHRRLSLDLPASLETQDLGASGSFASLAQSPNGEVWQVALLCISATFFFFSS